MSEAAARVNGARDDAYDRLTSAERMLDEAQQLLHGARAQMGTLNVQDGDEAFEVSRNARQRVEEAVTEISKALREATEAQGYLGRVEGLTFALPGR